MTEDEKKEAIKKRIAEKRQQIQSDSPQVEIARMNTEAVGKLADQGNEIFSQLYKDTLQDETMDYALAINFATHPLQSLEDRLKSRGIKEKVLIQRDLEGFEEEKEIPVRIQVDMYINFLKEFLIRRHCLNRKRVDEYIDALDKVNGKETIYRDPNQRQSLLNRLG